MYQLTTGDKRSLGTCFKWNMGNVVNPVALDNYMLQLRGGHIQNRISFEK